MPNDDESLPSITVHILRDIRDELRGLRGEVVELRGEVGGLRGEVVELRGEVGGLRGEVGGLRSEVGGLRSEMDARFESLERVTIAGFEGVAGRLDHLRNTAGWSHRDHETRIRDLEARVEHLEGR
jgi:hypothetical protein